MRTARAQLLIIVDNVCACTNRVDGTAKSVLILRFEFDSGISWFSDFIDDLLPYSWPDCEGAINFLASPVEAEILGMSLSGYTESIANYMIQQAVSSELRLKFRRAVSIHSLGGEALQFAHSDSIDSPLGVKADGSVLRNQRNLEACLNGKSGLVADGVTPLLVRFSFSSAPPAPVSHTIDLSVEGGSLLSEGIAEKLRVLGDAGWTATSTLIQDSDVEFAHIAPISADDVFLTPGSTHLTVYLRLQGPGVDETADFQIRKPPVVLIHGYNADKSTWSNGFLDALAFSRGTDFVLPINYGVNGSSSANYFNTYGPLKELARMLHAVLSNEVESATSEAHKNWAFTRYDLVGHSQGGLLARILSSESETEFFPAFRNRENQYRGRFHRVVTIGSPHNGTRSIYYAKRLLHSENLYGWVAEDVLVALFNVLQIKFDPFGLQIEDVHNFAVDPNARFHVIQTQVDDGYPPGPQHCFRLAYYLGLCHQYSPGVSRGSFVLPRGSDGICDVDSQRAGAGTRVTPITSENICHSGPLEAFLFGVEAGSKQTASLAVAEAVRGLLDGPASEFGSFVVPDLLPETVKMLIDSVVPNTLRGGGRIAPVMPRPGVASELLPAAQTAVFEFQLVPASNAVPEAEVVWSVEVFGTNGVSSAGVSLDVSTNDFFHVRLSINGDVQGDVVLYANYISTDGSLVFAQPALVVSRPPGTNVVGIEFAASSTSLTVDQVLIPELWASYSNGARSRFFISPDQPAVYLSSNPNVVEFGTNGLILAKAMGTASLTATYRGFTAQIGLSVIPQSGAPMVMSPRVITDSLFEMEVAGLPDVSYRIDGSTNLVAWQAITNLISSTGISTFTRSIGTNFPLRFFRAIELP